MWNDRIDFIDTAKGICMALVVLYHINTYYMYREIDIVASFHMPLFFLLAGCFFKSYSSYSEFLRRKTNQLLIPFFFFYIITSVLLPNLLHFVGYDVRSVNAIGLNSMFNFIFYDVWPNSPIWFLLSLFFINNLYYVYSKLFKGNLLYVGLASFLSALIGYIFSEFSINVYMYIDTALTGVFFFWIGNVLYNKTKFFKAEIAKNKLITIVIAGVCVVALLGHGVNWAGNNLARYSIIEVYLPALLGSFAVIALSKFFDRLFLFTFIGKHSLVVLCTHNLVLQFLFVFFSKIGFPPLVVILSMLCITLFLYFIIVPILYKVIPVFVGRKPLLR